MKPETIVPNTQDIDEEKFLSSYLNRRSKAKRHMLRHYNRYVRRNMKRYLKNYNEEDL